MKTYVYTSEGFKEVEIQCGDISMDGQYEFIEFSIVGPVYRNIQTKQYIFCTWK
jgi:hypothetical protein